MTAPADLLQVLTEHLAVLVLLGWVVRIPPLAREEGHEAITRAAWVELPLTVEQREALISGVRAPDVSLLGLVVSALPHGQRRHALRAWSGTTTRRSIEQMREFLSARHAAALAQPDGPRRWAAFGEVLHCVQDSFSPAHVDRDGARVVRMKHWGPLDPLRRRGSRDEHGFPTDARDSAWRDGRLTDEARAAATASRRYLEIVLAAPAASAASAASIGDFLDEVATLPEG